jgi:hypothetical protein
LRKDTVRSRKSDRDRLIQNLRDLFDEAALRAQQTEPGLSINEVFERFAEEESPNYGLNLRRFKQQILERPETGSSKRPALFRTTA